MGEIEPLEPRWTGLERCETSLVFLAPDFGNLKTRIAGLNFRRNSLGRKGRVAGAEFSDFGGLSGGEIVFFVGILGEVE